MSDPYFDTNRFSGSLTAAKPKAGRARPALAVTACAAATFLVYPYAYGRVWNHSLQIPLISRIHDPSLYPGDTFVDSLRQYSTLFWPAVAWITQWFPMEPTFLIGHIITLLIAFSAVFALARSLHPDEPRAPYFALWLYFWWSFEIGGESLHWFYWTHTAVATAGGMWALVLALRGYRLWPFLLAGFVFNIHALQGVYLLLMLGAASLLKHPKRPLYVIAGPALWLTIALPTAYALARNSATESPTDMGELLYAMFPAHFFASGFSRADWIGVFVCLGVFIAGVVMHSPNQATRRTTVMGAAILAFMIVGGVLSEIHPAGVLLKLHVFRASSYLVILALCLFAGPATRYLRLRRPPVVGITVTTLIALAGLDVHLLLHSSFGNVICLSQFIVFALLGVAYLVLSSRAHELLAAGVILAGTAFVAVILWHNWTQDLTAYYSAKHKLRAGGEWEQVQRWAHDHTQRDDLFMVPPDCEGFRVFSQRPVVAEWKDGAAIMWAPETAPGWRTWYVRMGGTFDHPYAKPIWARLKDVWMEKSPDQILALAREYNATYIVIDRLYLTEHDWKGPFVYQDPVFSVVKVDAAPESDSAKNL